MLDADQVHLKIVWTIVGDIISTHKLTIKVR